MDRDILFLLGDKCMTLLELFVIAVGLSMDAFAVSVCKGLSIKEKSFKTAWGFKRKIY